MIVFTGNPNIISEDYIKDKSIDPLSVRGFNLSSPLNMFKPLRALLPIQESLTADPRDEGFEQAYIMYIASNPEARIELLTIMETVYLGGIAVVLIGTEEYFRALINECLSKAISQLYGYPVVYAEDTADLYYAKEGEFSLLGLMAYDRDRSLMINHHLEEMNNNERREIMGE